MLQDLSSQPANPSSVHWFGQQARHLLTNARATVASFFNARAEEIIFTSGGTESLNFLLRGLPKNGHLITTSIEHAAIYKTLPFLNLEVTLLPVGLYGAPLPQQVEEALRPNTSALIFSAANGETGVKIDLEAIASIAQKHSIPLFIDAVAFIGKEPFPLYPGISGVALSAHKFHGPKGIGALYLKSNLKLLPSLTGGNQENARRAGTENLAGVLGLAEAVRILMQQQPQITQTITELRTRFESALFSLLPDLTLNGEGPRISNTSNIAFHGVDGETLLMHLDLAGVAVSHGSACSSGALEPSRVLTNMGLSRKAARSSLRFSLSRLNTLEEVDRAIDIVADTVKKLRQISSLSLR